MLLENVVCGLTASSPSSFLCAMEGIVLFHLQSSVLFAVVLFSSEEYSMSLFSLRDPHMKDTYQFAELETPIAVPLILSRSTGASRSSQAPMNWRVLDQTVLA